MVETYAIEETPATGEVQASSNRRNASNSRFLCSRTRNRREASHRRDANNPNCISDCMDASNSRELATGRMPAERDVSSSSDASSSRNASYSRDARNSRDGSHSRDTRNRRGGSNDRGTKNRSHAIIGDARNNKANSIDASNSQGKKQVKHELQGRQQQ
jgi:hypothetical protein